MTMAQYHGESIEAASNTGHRKERAIDRAAAAARVITHDKPNKTDRYEFSDGSTLIISQMEYGEYFLDWK